MKTKNILLLALSAMAVFYAINLLTESNNSTYDNPFVVADTANVTRIFMVDKQNNSIDLKRVNGTWVLNDGEKPIKENVDILLKTLLKIEILNPVSKSAYNHKIKQLATNSVKVEVYQNTYRINLGGLKLFPYVDKTHVFYVGSPTANNQGTLMKSEDEDALFITHIPGFRGYLTERFSARHADWISHEIFAYNIMDIRKVRVEFPRKPNESYEIINEGSKSFKLIQLANNQEVAVYDTIRVLEELAAFNIVNYEALLDNMSEQQIDSLKNIFPVRIVSVETKLGNRKKLSMYYRPNFDKREDMNGKLFDHDMDRLYAIIEGMKHPVSVQFFVVDNISRPLSYLVHQENPLANLGNENSN